MRTIEIARKLVSYGKTEEAQKAYSLVIHENEYKDPAEELESAVYILRSGGDYRIAYTCLKNLYNRGYFKEDILPLMISAFYAPNIKILKSRYEKNYKALSRYPYLFRKDFIPFDELPILFFPYDEGYIPYYIDKEQFGDYVNFNHEVISRNFFRNLDNPILADNVYSQYELEYLNDNVRKSEYIAKENHIYLHYTYWSVFCSYLQCLDLRKLLEDKKFVFLIEEEIAQYPIDFKERFGIDYSKYEVKPVGIREVNRLIWHTQLSSHNGGDFFNEIFDGHPNLICWPSVMFDNVEDSVNAVKRNLNKAKNLLEVEQLFGKWNNVDIAKHLYLIRNRTDKDILIGLFLGEKGLGNYVNFSSRIAPAIFFQPHFAEMEFKIDIDIKSNHTVLYSEIYEKIKKSLIFKEFKYIKTFTPMRRITTSYAASIKFMWNQVFECLQKDNKNKVFINDAISDRLLNRSFMIDWQDRLYKDSVLVRFEDGKLNPKATFSALAEFLDIPYTESMTYCSFNGERNPESYTGNDIGFSTAAIYRTYDEYINNNERYVLEYLMRDVYEYYGYDFHYYDGKTVDEERMVELVKGFSTLNSYMANSLRTIWENDRLKEKAAKSEKSSDENAMSEENTVAEDLDDKEFQEKMEERIKEYLEHIEKERILKANALLRNLYFVNKNGQPLHMMPKLELDPDLLEQPLYR